MSDRIKPTAPGTPVVSNIDAYGNATVTVSASTDNVGVTGYAAFIDGSPVESARSETTTIQLSDLTSGSHSVSVRAFDANNNISDLSGGTGFSVDLSGGVEPSVATTELPLNSRRYSNLFVSESRLLSPPTYATTAVVTDVDTATTEGVLSRVNEIVSGAAGRAFSSIQFAVEAGKWYAASMEIPHFILGSENDCGFRINTETAVIDYDNGLEVGGTQINAGGIGRYAIVFRVSTSGTLRFKYGLGVDNTKANLELSLKNLQFQEIDSKFGLAPSEYVYPEYSVVTNSYKNITVDANHFVTQHPATTYTAKPYSSILAVGDSRSDENQDAPMQLNLLMESEGRGVVVHGEGGWTTASVLGDTTITEYPGYVFNLDKAISGSLLRMGSSGTKGDWDIYDLPAEQNLDTLLIYNIGVNDINSGVGAATAMANIRIMADKGIAAGLKIVITDNTPCLGSMINSAEIIELKLLNKLIESECALKGYVFVELYSTFGDSTDPDKLSDGLGTTPDYVQDDGLQVHLNLPGSIVAAQLIKDAMDSLR